MPLFYQAQIFQPFTGTVIGMAARHNDPAHLKRPGAGIGGYLPASRDLTSSGTCEGVSATTTPAASSAARFPA